MSINTPQQPPIIAGWSCKCGQKYRVEDDGTSSIRNTVKCAACGEPREIPGGKWQACDPDGVWRDEI